MRAHSRTAVSVPTPLPGCARPWSVAAPHPSGLQERPPRGRVQPRELFFVAQVECQVGRLGENSGLNSHLWLGWHRAPDW